MEYRIEYKPRAVKSIGKLPRDAARRVVRGIERLSNDLAGDVKRLAAHDPSYRVRVGDYLILFDVDDDRIIIYEVWHRQHDYR